MIKIDENTKDMIIHILTDTLSYAYCDNCQNSSDDYRACDECHRKYQNWALSDATAAYLADKIINLINYD